MKNFNSMHSDLIIGSSKSSSNIFVIKHLCEASNLDLRHPNENDKHLNFERKVLLQVFNNHDEER